MRVCRFTTTSQSIRIGLMTDESAIIDLEPVGLTSLEQVLDHRDPVVFLRAFKTQGLKEIPVSDATLLSPVERQEIWAAGVTYLRSRTARMEESEFSATAYDRV